MSAQSLAISAPWLQRPRYDNTHVSSLPAWLQDNRRALIRWWWDCDVALRTGGGVTAAVDDEFEQFTRVQWERELQATSGA